MLSFSRSMFRALLVTVTVSCAFVQPGAGEVIRVKSASEISVAMFSARPGDTLLMENGTWVNQRISFVGHGTELNPIVLRAESLGSVVLTGNSTLRIGGEWLVVDGLHFNGGQPASGAVVEFRAQGPAYHCRLTNSAIRNYNPPEIGMGYKWVSLYGQHNRVDHCYFTGKTNAGALLVVWKNSDPDFHRIDHNWFSDRPPLGENGAEIIRIGTSDWSMYDSNCVVEDNLFQACNGEIEIISNKSCENIYRRNTFRACDGTLTLRHGNRCQVYQNFFLGDHVEGSGGVRIIGEDHWVYNNYFENLEGQSYRSAISLVNAVPDSPLNRYFQVKRALVMYNTVVNCHHSLTIGAGADEEKTLPPLDCTVANNVMFHEDPCDYLVQYEDEPNNLVYMGNIMYGAGMDWVDPEPGIVWQDPCLVPTESLWRPAALSPLLDAALPVFDVQDMNDLGCVTMGQPVIDPTAEDVDGQIRCVPYDVGADEWSDEPVINMPLTPDDVGPNVPAPPGR